MSKYFIADIAKDLGLNRRTVIRYVSSGFLPCEIENKGSRIIYTIDKLAYFDWKRKHFSGVAKSQISKLTDRLKELGKNEIKEQWVPEWLDWVKTGKLNGKPTSDRMIEIYDYYFNYFLDHLPPRPKPPVISVSNFREVLGLIPVEKYSTRYNTYSALMSITKYLVEKDLFKNEVRDQFKKLKPKRYLPAKRPCINEEQLQRVLSFIESYPYGSKYGKLLSKTLILFIARTGLRASEVASLKLEDINLNTQIIHVVLGKGRKNRKVGIVSDVKNLLLEYLKLRLNKFTGDKFFVTCAGTEMSKDTIHQRVERVAKHFDFHFTPHALRRAFVTININKGRPLVHLQIACGHADITTTRSYCQTNQDEVLEAMKNW